MQRNGLMSTQQKLLFWSLGVATTLIAYEVMTRWSRTFLWGSARYLLRNGASVSKRRDVVEGLAGLIGNTPLVRIKSLSDATGCEILAKAEFLNPGGSIKDRVALATLQAALKDTTLSSGGLITEGTAGSTGISLALVAQAAGCRCFIALPDDAAAEKSQILQAIGARVQRQRPVSITHPEHFVNVARRASKEFPNAVFADQFENSANFQAHLETGREILEQSRGAVDAFVCGAGTGGTIAGVSQVLKAAKPGVRVFLVDPPGSGLYNKVTRGVMFTSEEAEQKRLKNPFDTVTEGVGINRITRNFARAQIDAALRCSDREAVEMSRYLLRNEGLFVGSSSCVNCVGAVKAARLLPKGSTLVTILCDSGERHLSKFHNAEYLQSVGLTPTTTGSGLHFVN